MDRAATEPLRPTDPAQVGPYRLLGRLGEGGMGTVFLALAPQDGAAGGDSPESRLVAVKVVKPELTAEEGFAARFHAEVTNARRVASFCTAQVLDNGNTPDGRPYMVTEYISGIPLSRQIAEYGPLEAGPLHGMALGVAAALAAIHAAGLVHRDLKPSNVILSLTGPRVIDFGIARAVDATHSFTRSGELLGTPGWWAPEQVRGGTVTPAADVFAWGCLVGYAATGRHPYGRGDPLTLAARVLNVPPDLGTLPAPLDELARQATHLDPEQRPTAQELLLALVGGAPPAASRAPAPAAEEVSTRKATEILSRLWEPPANVAEQVEQSEQSEPTVLLPVRERPPRPPETFAPPPPETLAPPQPPETLASPQPPPGEATLPPSGTLPAEPLREAATQGVRLPDEPPPRPRRRWLLPVAAVTAALAATLSVLVTLWPEPDARRPDPVRAEERTTGPAPGRGDTGRSVRLGASPTAPELVITRPVRCGPAESGEAASPGGRLCLVRWTLLNTLGGEETPVAVQVVLADDRGTRHTPAESAGSLPATLGPGGRADGVLIFELPADRTADRLVVSADGTDPIEVRLR